MDKYLRIAEDECSGKTDTMDYVKCRATKMEKDQGTPAEKAFPTAWSIACKYKRDQLSDADEHCQKKPSEYFKAKKANGDSMNIPKRYLASELEAELDMTARFKKDVPADPTENMSEEDKEKWEAMKDEHGDKFKTAHLSRKQENLLKRLRNPAMAWEDLSERVQATLVDQLIKDVDAWLSHEYFGKLASDMTAEEAEYAELMAGQTPESFKKMYDNMSEADKKKWEANKDKYGDKFKKAHNIEAGCENLPNEKMQQMCEDKKKDSKEDEKEDKKAHDKTARLMKRQIKILEKFVAGKSDVPLFFDQLPSNVIALLRRVKDQETLHMDVERWLGDWKMEQRMNSRWANSPYLTRSAKENPMNKTAKMALRTLTANWGLTAIEAEDMLADEEMADYLAEMEALAFEEMMADELEAGGNSSFKKYKQQGQSGWFIPNTTNKDRGGAGAGKDGDNNHLYHDYGSAPKGKAYQDWYSKNKLWNKENRPSKESPRKVCPGMSGKSMDC